MYVKIRTVGIYLLIALKWIFLDGWTFFGPLPLALSPLRGEGKGQAGVDRNGLFLTSGAQSFFRRTSSSGADQG